MRLLFCLCLACGLVVAGISEGVHGEANPNVGMDGTAADGDLTVTTPAGWSDGQLGILLLYLDAGDGSTPTGWTEVSGSPFGSGTAKMCIFRKFLDIATDSTAVTTISGLSGAAGGTIFTFNGADGTTPVEAVGQDSSMTSGATAYGYSVNTVTDSAWALICCGWGDNGVAAAAKFDGSTDGVTDYAAGGSSVGDDVGYGVGYKPFNTAGATGVGQMAAPGGGNDPWVGVVLVVKPAAAAATTIAPGFFFR